MMRQDELIGRLNPLLRGWANYYRHVVSKHTFDKVSCAMWQSQWRWARRRHPNKGADRVRRKYFRTVGFRHWVFATETDKMLSTGAPELLALYDIAGMPIKRHRRIRADANPCDPKSESYFEDRLGLAMRDSIKGRTWLIRMWLGQERQCPVCQQLITKSTWWRLYHVEQKVDGGRDTNANLVMLHPDCHQIARARRFKVVKPASSTRL